MARLSQQEIDAIVKARRAKSSQVQKSVRPWDFRLAGQLANDKARTITALHEAFARSLTNSVGVYLRVPFEVTLVSVEQLVYREFLERLLPLTYLVSFGIHPQEIFATMQIDHSIVLAVVDVLLGGTGETDTIMREISEIEESITGVVANMICRELQNAWQPFGVEIQIGERQRMADMPHFLPPTERALLLTFDVQMSKIRGAVNLLFPAGVSKIVARDLAKDWAYQTRNRDKDFALRLRQKMMDCNFAVELGVPRIRMTTRELLQVKTGDVLKLNVPARSPASLRVSGRGMFEAAPVRIESRRAAQLGDREPLVQEEEEAATK
jgi:flagellar motor switch protein FliM